MASLKPTGLVSRNYGSFADKVVKADISLSPAGVAVREYGPFTRDVTVTLTGSQANADGGNVQATGVIESIDSQLGPTGLVNKPRVFTNKDPAGTDVFINLVGAEAEGQAANPDLTNVNVYVDGAEAETGAGSVSQSEPEVAGVEIQAQAGTVSSSVGISVTLTGAEVSAIGAEVAAVDGIGINIDGAAASAGAGTPSILSDAIISITGAVAAGEAAAPGIDNKTDIAATIGGAAAQAEAEDMALVGPHVVVDLVGAQASAIAGEVDKVKAKKRGRSRKRYVVEVDGQLIQAASIADVEAVLRRVREIAEESAERDVQGPTAPNPPRVEVKTGTGRQTSSQTIQRDVQRTQQTVTRAYNRRAEEIAQDIEISKLMLAKIEQEEREDEEAIIRLLLM